MNSIWPMLIIMTSCLLPRSLYQVCSSTHFRLHVAYSHVTALGMVKEVTGETKITYHPNEDDKSQVFEVDFTPPFRRVK